MEQRPHCLVIGVGEGFGMGCVRKFASQGYVVSMVARNAERLGQFESEVDEARGYAADIEDLDSFRAVLAGIVEEHGLPEVVIYNAARASFGSYDTVPVEQFERNFRTNATGLLVVAQDLLPSMVERGHGSLMVTGNTAATRGKPLFVGWAPTKAAQRILAEALAREVGPKGVHVAYFVVDAAIDMPFARARFGKQPKDFYAQPDDLAETVYHVSQQPRSAWSFLVELRPFGENW